MGAIAVLGATGRVGRILARRLCDAGHEVLALGRDGSKMGRVVDARCRCRLLDLAACEAGALREALAGAEVVIACTPPHLSLRIAAGLPQDARRLVVLGSTRRFNPFPDPVGDEVRRVEQALRGLGVEAFVLHPTMIYGAGDNNVSRVLELVRRTPIVPLVGGGRGLVQPVHVDDVVEALVAAATAETLAARSVVVAGPAPMTYADMVHACARALGRGVRVIALPLWLMLLLARFSYFFPGLPRVRIDEVRRSLKGQAFDVGELSRVLGVTPTPFEQGLRRMLHED